MGDDSKMKRQHDKLFRHVFPALQTKMNEFKYYDYNAISIDDLWNYCIVKKWRKKQIEKLPLHEIVSTILNISPSEIVSHGQIQEFQSSNWFSDLNNDELQFLLNPKVIKEPQKEE